MVEMNNETRALQKSSAELIVLALVEQQPRHGYEIAKLIEARSQGKLEYHVASLYPMLYRMESKGWVEGRWVEKAGERRRRFYRITPHGRKVLEKQRETWSEFFEALQRVAGIQSAS
jgi:PadR family transcriptional regulator, regulatory protein PadR